MHDDTYIDENAKGYVYCYDKSKFQETEKGSMQFVCYKPLKPEMVVEVYYTDYKELFENVVKEVSV